jgi:FMN-dependent NADH-azoreductase
MVIVTARGGSFTEGSPAAPYDYQEPYLRTLFGFLGITDVSFIHLENLSAGDDVREQSLTQAQKAIAQAVTTW